MARSQSIMMLIRGIDPLVCFVLCIFLFSFYEDLG